MVNYENIQEDQCIATTDKKAEKDLVDHKNLLSSQILIANQSPSLTYENISEKH